MQLLLFFMQLHKHSFIRLSESLSHTHTHVEDAGAEGGSAALSMYRMELILQGLQVLFPLEPLMLKYAYTRKTTRLYGEQSLSQCIWHIMKARFGLIVGETH